MKPRDDPKSQPSLHLYFSHIASFAVSPLSITFFIVRGRREMVPAPRGSHAARPWEWWGGRRGCDGGQCRGEGCGW